MITRRKFLATVGTLAGGAVLGAPACSSARNSTSARRPLERIGIQLYSVRTEMQKNVPGTLARLAQIGYKEVEFAGYFGRPVADIRMLLQTNGLSAPSTHVPIQLMRTEWDKTLDVAAEIGHSFVTIPWVDEKERGSVDHWRRLADEFNRAAEQARARDIRFAYHNHDFEFRPVEGQVPLEILLANTNPAVFFELDLYWTVFAGRDPLDLIRRYPNRIALVHVKDSAGAPDHRMVDVGAGRIDFAGILRADADQNAAIKHVFVEHDQPADPFAFATNSYQQLSKLEY